jgi:6-phosphogluconolactonase
MNHNFLRQSLQLGPEGNMQGAAVGKVIRFALHMTLVATLSACGNGNSGPIGVADSAGDGSSQFSIGGTVSGLTGKGLVLQNGSETLAISGSGAFTFPSRVGRGRYYTVFVKTQPTSPTQLCAVSNSDGIVPAEKVTKVVVRCGPV